MCVVVCVVCNKDYVRIVEEEEGKKKKIGQGYNVEKENDVHGKVNNGQTIDHSRHLDGAT